MAADLSSHLVDITKCWICKEECKDPRSPACLHAFCLECIRDYCTKPGVINICNGADCPVCGCTFWMLNDGVEAIKPNRFVAKLIKKAAAAAGGRQCEGCGLKSGSKATVRCTDCAKNFCDGCSRQCRLRRKRKAGPHSVKKLDKDDAENNELDDYCELHSGKKLEAYCNECTKMVCETCCAVDNAHFGHNTDNITDMSKEIVKEIDPGTSSLVEILEQLRKEKSQTEERYDKIKISADGTPEEKDMCVRFQKNERSILAIESFMKYWEAVTDKGTACDVVRSAEYIKDRISTLNKTQIEKDPEPGFEPARLYGEICTKNVKGVTHCDNKLFVVTYKCDTISVFTVNSCEELPSIKIKGMKDPLDVAACQESNYLYVADWDIWSTGVWRVSLDGRSEKWVPNKRAKVPVIPASLSVRSGRLLVTTNNNEIVLYGADGLQLKRIQFTDIKRVYHAVQSPQGTFIVTCCWPSKEVREVDENGIMIRVYSGNERLDEPCHLAINPDGQIYVTDVNRDFILELSKSMELKRVLLKAWTISRKPSRLCFIEPNAEHKPLLVVTSYSYDKLQIFRLQ